MTMMLLRGGRVHSGADPEATAVAVTDGVISWIGAEHGIAAAGRPDTVVDLGGAWVSPGFVDAHVHTTDAGLALTGLDLSAARSLTDCLDRVAAFAAGHPGAVVWGHGWDETRWPENRSPSRLEIDTRIGRRPVYLSRADVHSAAVSSALVDAAGEDLPQLPGFDPDRPLTRAAHHAVRNAAKLLLTTQDRAAAQRAFLRHAASRGIVEVHECAAGDAAGREDLAALLALESPIGVLGYLAAAVTDPGQARELIAATGAHALAGDLSVDGAIGSRTASLASPYTDDHTSCGTRYLTDEEILDHLVACARAGVQPGFHAIGEDAVAGVGQALRRAAERLAADGPVGRSGTVALAAVTPRIEHAEMADAASIAAFAATGTVASVQPLFDAAWGGPAGMYVRRLGEQRATPMNPFAALASAGVALALGSDAPVTPAEPWQAVQAAVHHRTPGSGLSARAAFTAHTRGGHRAAGRVDRGVGTISVGAPAHLAISAVDDLVRPAADPSVARWSLDPRSRVPTLPDLTPGATLPRVLATLIAGRVVFDTGIFDPEVLGDPGRG